MITDVNIKLDDNTLTKILYSSQIFYFSPVNLKILKKQCPFTDVVRYSVVGILI